jgi:hypothetical protein
VKVLANALAPAKISHGQESANADPAPDHLLANPHPTNIGKRFGV